MSDFDEHRQFGRNGKLSAINLIPMQHSAAHNGTASHSGPLPVNTAAYPNPDAHPTPIAQVQTQQLQVQAQQVPPPLVSTPVPVRRSRVPRIAIPVLLLLIVLVVLIATGGILGRQWLPGQSPLSFGAPASVSQANPFIQSSLNAQQINDIMHLSGYMKYKQLAGLYVDRMSLDVEIGQLIMVEYNDTYYSSDLNEMVNQLHAGGVIMYQFQMPTAASTIQQIRRCRRTRHILCSSPPTKKAVRSLTGSPKFMARVRQQPISAIAATPTWRRSRPRKRRTTCSHSASTQTSPPMSM